MTPSPRILATIAGVATAAVLLAPMIHLPTGKGQRVVGPGPVDCPDQYCYLRAVRPAGVADSSLVHFAPSMLPPDEREAFERECLTGACVVTLTAAEGRPADDIVQPLHATWTLARR